MTPTATTASAPTAVARTTSRSPRRPAGTTVGNAVTAVQGGQRFQAITLTTPGTVALSNVGITAKFNNFGASSYDGYFLSSDDKLNKIWYQGVYTNQTNGIPAGGVVQQRDDVQQGADDPRRRQARPPAVERRPVGPEPLDGRQPRLRGRRARTTSSGTIGGFGSAPARQRRDLRPDEQLGQLPARRPSPARSTRRATRCTTCSISPATTCTRATCRSRESQYQVMKNQLAYNRTLVDADHGPARHRGERARLGLLRRRQAGRGVRVQRDLLQGADRRRVIASDLAQRDPGNANVATWQADAATWTSQAADLKAAHQRDAVRLRARRLQARRPRQRQPRRRRRSRRTRNAEAINYGLAPDERARRAS